MGSIAVKAGIDSLSDDDRRGFSPRVAELPERFGVEVHASVLMDNQEPSLRRTPELNLSHAIRRPQETQTSRFNRSLGTVGQWFQGRFKAQILQDEGRLTAVARSIHLNPVGVDGPA